MFEVKETYVTIHAWKEYIKSEMVVRWHWQFDMQIKYFADKIIVLMFEKQNILQLLSSLYFRSQKLRWL